MGTFAPQSLAQVDCEYGHVVPLCFSLSLYLYLYLYLYLSIPYSPTMSRSHGAPLVVFGVTCYPMPK